MKCSRYNGDDSDCIKCKISYSDFKSKSLSLQMATHHFVIGGDDDVPSEEEVMHSLKLPFYCSFTYIFGVIFRYSI